MVPELMHLSEEQVAKRANERLARELWRYFCISIAISGFLLVVMGVIIYVAATLERCPGWLVVVAFDVFLLALIPAVFALDSYVHWREARSRRWKTITPRFSSPDQPRTPAETATSSPG
jgi:uncharacterized membrane protein